MAFFKKILLLIWLIFCTVNMLFSCNCQPARQLTVEDWNDADIIFTATLTDYKMGRVGALDFKINEIFKGTVDPTITFYFQPGKSHTLLHAVKAFNKTDEWIVFARKLSKGDKTYYHLKDTGSKLRCALSRPLQKDSIVDPYLTFLKNSNKYSEGFQQFFDEQRRMIAEGKYQNQIPVEKWTYFKPNRKALISGYYSNGQRDGEWTEVQENANNHQHLIRKTIYQNGEPITIFDYNHLGKVSLEKTFTDSTEIRLYFRKNGSLKSKVIANFENNTSEILTYFDNELINEQRFLKDKKMMRQYWYDKNGKIVKKWERDVNDQSKN